MEKSKLTVALITRNNAAVLARALESVRWADAILVVDDESSDETVAIAKRYGAKVIEKHFEGFAAKRNAALAQVDTDWVFYLDADEVVPEQLAQEIQSVVRSAEPGVYTLVRTNVFLGVTMYPDTVERLFHTTKLKEWHGDVHEHPVIEGSTQALAHHLMHYTHTDITSMLTKTNQWSEIEAQLRIEAHHPAMAWWRFITVAVRVWWEQLVKKRVWRYGRAGWFEGYFQMIDKLVVYTKLWERQQKE